MRGLDRKRKENQNGRRSNHIIGSPTNGFLPIKIVRFFSLNLIFSLSIGTHTHKKRHLTFKMCLIF